MKANKRYAGSSNWTVQEAAECVRQDFGSIDILVHSLANGPEARTLSETVLQELYSVLPDGRSSEYF